MVIFMTEKNTILFVGIKKNHVMIKVETKTVFFGLVFIYLSLTVKQKKVSRDHDQQDRTQLLNTC